MTEQKFWTVESEATDESCDRVAELVCAWVAEETARRGEEPGEAEVDRARAVIEWMARGADHPGKEELTARLDELSQMIVHELKNPIAQVQIGVEMLAKRPEALRDEERTYFGWIERGLARAVQVLDDVRVLGLAEASQGSRRIPIATVVEGILTRVREEAERAGVACGVEGELPGAHVDGAQVGMALGNLVANAVKYADPSKPERWVRIRVERVTGVVEGWRFSVADNGLGIPARLQREVFRRHFRGHPGAAEGMGLGLSIARQVIERRDGHIWFHSEERKGSIFNFVVPDLPRPVASVAEPSMAAVASSSLEAEG
jgi:signal transduction histidine kinase